MKNKTSLRAAPHLFQPNQAGCIHSWVVYGALITFVQPSFLGQVVWGWNHRAPRRWRQLRVLNKLPREGFGWLFDWICLRACFTCYCAKSYFLGTVSVFVDTYRRVTVEVACGLCSDSLCWLLQLGSKTRFTPSFFMFFTSGWDQIDRFGQDGWIGTRIHRFHAFLNQGFSTCRFPRMRSWATTAAWLSHGTVPSSCLFSLNSSKNHILGKGSQCSLDLCW